MRLLQKVLTRITYSLITSLAIASGALLLPISASAGVLDSSHNATPTSVASPLLWAGTSCYNLISAKGDWAQFCVTVNVNDWTEAKQALVSFRSYSGNFSFLRIDGLDLNRNERIVKSENYMQQYLNSPTGFFSTGWSYTFFADYSAAVNMPCVIWENGDWACASPTWYISAKVYIV